MTLCHMTGILFLEPFTECAQSVEIRTDAFFDQDCVLKANEQVVYSVHGRVIVDHMYEFQHPLLLRKMHESNAEESMSANSKRSGFRVLKRSPRLMYITAWSRKSVCSLCHPRASLGSQSSRNFLLLVAPCFALCSCIALALLIAVMIRSQ